jgi:hypothetical protein
MDGALLRALVKMTFKAPLLLELTLEFMRSIECCEGFQILSRKYRFEITLIKEIVEVS